LARSASSQSSPIHPSLSFSNLKQSPLWHHRSSWDHLLSWT